jgi:phytoene dehydrogenase-like protein
MTEVADFIIVGAGPAALTLAWVLAHHGGYSVAIFEREDSIGGCHRVRRVGGLFTEHGPRIYSDAYINFKRVLSDMGLSFDALFVPYKFDMTNIGGRTYRGLPSKEQRALTTEFLRFTKNSDQAKQQTVADMLSKHKFSAASWDYFDRLCRLTDGAGAERYTLFEFFQLINQNALNSLYQPRYPNDYALFRHWQRALQRTGRVDFKLGIPVRAVIAEDGRATGIVVRSTVTGSRGSHVDTTFKASRGVIMAVPPLHLVEVLQQSEPEVANSFGQFPAIQSFAERNAYFSYIPVTFHWNQRFVLPNLHGFPASDWAIAFVVQSDYTSFRHPSSRTVISVAVTRPDARSQVTGRTANETRDVKQLVEEMLRQLRTVLPGLPEPTRALLSPGVSYSQNSLPDGGPGGSWTTRDTAWVMTTDDRRIPQQAPKLKGLYSVGSHNRLHSYHFTSMESAITNALALGHELVPTTAVTLPIGRPSELKSVLYVIAAVAIWIVLWLLGRIAKRWWGEGNKTGSTSTQAEMKTTTTVVKKSELRKRF